MVPDVWGDLLKFQNIVFSLDERFRRELTWAVDSPRAAQNNLDQLCGFAAQFL